MRPRCGSSPAWKAAARPVRPALPFILRCRTCCSQHEPSASARHFCGHYVPEEARRRDLVPDGGMRDLAAHPQATIACPSEHIMNCTKTIESEHVHTSTKRLTATCVDVNHSLVTHQLSGFVAHELSAVGDNPRTSASPAPMSLHAARCTACPENTGAETGRVLFLYTPAGRCQVANSGC